MNFENTQLTQLSIYTSEELFLNFIDDKRNEDIEKKFSSYIGTYFNFDKNDTLKPPENIKIEISKRRSAGNTIIIKFNAFK